MARGKIQAVPKGYGPKDASLLEAWGKLSVTGISDCTLTGSEIPNDVQSEAMGLHLCIMAAGLRSKQLLFKVVHQAEHLGGCGVLYPGRCSWRTPILSRGFWFSDAHHGLERGDRPPLLCMCLSSLDESVHNAAVSP